ncbi:hypothetical protein [Psychrobacillus psychrodurans]|uniref:hypothetical protein n=1 Tax=Psychrobacillus psychrodurans TaxID=126157 RepID=UPI0008F33530|nr:hypothetical protein [Psychrobacillus psychrodurans]MCZ8540284.1 hypothetical protein [Psychrobacillus psychrodurans]SFM61329.1 hypothetical protein SAMN05421832_104152 [Psychrobacillus psychrodurans]
MMNWMYKNSWNAKEIEEGKDLSIKDVATTYKALQGELKHLQRDIKRVCDYGDYVSLKRLIKTRERLQNALLQIEETYEGQLTSETNTSSNLVHKSQISVMKIREKMATGFKTIEKRSITLASEAISKSVDLIETSNKVHLRINRFLVNQSIEGLKNVSNRITNYSNINK